MTERLGDGLQNHLCQFDSDSTLHSPITQLVEWKTVNLFVAGSRPARGANRPLVLAVARQTPNLKAGVRSLYGLPKKVKKRLDNKVKI